MKIYEEIKEMAESWISVKARLPEPETEVLAVCVRNGYRFICPVIFEDGTMLTQNSMWNWYELGNYGTYSEENDDYFVPEGWWENRQFTPDDIYNNPVDCTVTHWMPLPDLPKGARMDGGDRRMRASTCKGCGAAIVWIRTPGGKSMPCDATPRYYIEKPRSGSKKIVTPNGEVISCEYTEDPHKATGTGFAPHWGSCLAAGTFRK